MAIKHVTTEEFHATTGEGVTLVDFWAPWCGPCKMIAPILEEVDQHYNGKVKVVKVDVDEEQLLAAQYGIMGIPALLVLKNGEIVEREAGVKPFDALKDLIEPHL